MCALANAWPDGDGKLRRDSTGLPLGTRPRQCKPEKTVKLGKAAFDKPYSVKPGGPDQPRPKLKSCAKGANKNFERILYTGSRSGRLRHVAAQAEARSELAFSAWWREARDSRVREASAAGVSSRPSASDRLAAVRARRGLPALGA